MAKKIPQKPAKAERPTKVEFETFRTIGAYEISSLQHDTPSCFNGEVRLHRYRFTVELIPESKEVLAARLQDLWDNSRNHHDSEPLRTAAIEIGYELIGSRGNKAQREY